MRGLKILIGLALWGCILALQIEAQEVVTLKKTIGYLERFEFKGVGNIEVVQGDHNEMTIAAPQAVLDRTKVKVQGGAVVIEPKGWFFKKPFENFSVQLMVTEDLDRIVLSNGANLKSGKLKLSNIRIDLNGASKAALNLEAKTVIAEIIGSGELYLSGAVETADLWVQGKALYHAEEMVAEACNIHIEGGARAFVQASDSLKVVILGSGEVIYTGDPHVKQNISGTGRLIRQ